MTPHKTHILFLDTNDAMGGVVQVHLNLLRTLNRQKLRVTLACHPRGMVIDKFRGVRQLHPLPVNAGTKSSRHCQSRLSPIYDLVSIGLLSAAVLKLLRYCRRYRVDVIYTSDKKRSVLVSYFLSCLTGLPVIYHCHSVYVDYKINRWLLRNAAAVIANSNAVKADFIRQGGSQMHAITVIHNGLDEQLYSPASNSTLRGDLGVDADHVLIGVTARLAPEKGQDVFLKAAARVVEQTKKVRFIIVGDTSIYSDNANYVEYLHSLVQRLRLQNHVIFTGFRQDMVNVYRGLDVVVDPAWLEPFGMVVIEPMACGRVVVGTDKGGIPEIIRHGENGFLFPPGDEQALAQVLLYILNNRRECCLRLAKSARQTVLERFTIARQTQQLEEILLDIAQGNEA